MNPFEILKAKYEGKDPEIIEVDKNDTFEMMLDKAKGETKIILLTTLVGKALKLIMDSKDKLESQEQLQQMVHDNIEETLKQNVLEMKKELWKE